MRTERARLIETLWDLIIDDRDTQAPTSTLIRRCADSILADIDAGIINKSEEV